MFQDKIVLIVEDEPFIAIELADAVKSLGGTVLGPLSTVDEALALLDGAPVDAAILDVQLLDRDITPVALRLLGEGIPLVFHTATGLPPSLAGHETLLVMKPRAPQAVLTQLQGEIEKNSRRSKQ